LLPATSSSLPALLRAPRVWALADAANRAAATVDLERIATSWVSGHRSVTDARGSR